jgi:hypothetical protein
MTVDSGSGRLTALLRRFWKELAATVAVLAGITVLLTFVGLGPKDPPPSTGGEIKVTDTVPNETLREHLEEVGLPTDDYTEEQLDQEGMVFNVSVTIRGYQGQKVPLRWTMRDAIADDELTEPEFDDELADTFTPNSQDATMTSRVWTPIPGYAGTFQIELRLISPDDGELAQQNGPEFETTPPDAR